jgi:hypothetical protein
MSYINPRWIRNCGTSEKKIRNCGAYLYFQIRNYGTYFFGIFPDSELCNLFFGVMGLLKKVGSVGLILDSEVWDSPHTTLKDFSDDILRSVFCIRSIPIFCSQDHMSKVDLVALE